VGTVKECGEIFAYKQDWDKARAKKAKNLEAYDGKTFEETLFDDPIMVELIENDMADIFTTDIIAAALMCSQKSNYSFDVEIKKYGTKYFIDKRVEDEHDEETNITPEDNILDFDTVCETALENQPMDDESINGIWPLMKEARKINNQFLYHALDKDLMKRKELEEENPFIEDEH